MTAIKSLKVLLIALSCAYISTLSAPAQGDDATAQQPPVQPASANGNEARLLEDACSGNLEAIQAAIKEGVNINCRTTEGNTVLTLAAANGHLETVTFLAQNYPQLINQVDNNGFNALHFAALNGQLETVRFLTDRYPQLINQVDNHGRNA